MKKEYVIWGYPENSDEHTLLNNNAADMKGAESIMQQLAADHGCTRMTVQVIDLAQPFNFAKAALG